MDDPRQRPPTIQALLREHRRFEPPEDFRRRARVQDPEIYARAARDPAAFWEGFARELRWAAPWKRALSGSGPEARWFVGGKLNASVNCLDRHLEEGRGDKIALVWEGEPGEVRRLSYRELHREVNRFGNVLRRLGIQAGDRVAIYMPMVPEAIVAMLACARIGAIHSVVFGGFSAEALRDRILDAEAKLLVTADGGYRRGQVVPLKQTADQVVAETPSVERVVVVARTGQAVPLDPRRDVRYETLVRDADRWCEPAVVDANHPLFTLYTSGTTGKPKGIVHSTGGYLTGTYATSRWVFDLRDEDLFWCTADIGWITGHSYIVYGPLAAGASVLVYEGAPDWPERDRFWAIAARHGVSVFYTAPTAIRAFMRWGASWVERHDLSRLRLLGTVGEPINPEAWIWYHEHVGGGRCPIVDTWWQTETGQILITPLPGLTATKPGSATLPFPGVGAEIRDEAGREVPLGGGYLALTRPWPARTLGIWGDPQRFVDTYFGKWDRNTYFTGDGAKRDEDGYFWILGRVDDVINVAGHRIGTMEVESALVSHAAVAEAAVIGVPDELKGTAIAAFVSLREGVAPEPQLTAALREHVVRKIGSIARPRDVFFAAELPKTRSGKIMRRLLRDVAEGRALGDTTTLADPAVVQRLREQYEEREG